MVTTITNKYLKCDLCGSHLTHPLDHSMLSWRGEWVAEDTKRHLEEVSLEYGWKVEEGKHICHECTEL